MFRHIKFAEFLKQKAGYQWIGRTRNWALSLVARVLGLVSATAVAILALPHANAFSADAVLLEFSSEYCGHCRAMQPVIQSLAQKGVPVRQVNVRREPDLASRYGIRQTPTYVVIAEGREVSRLVGAHTENEIVTALNTDSGSLIPTGANMRLNAAPRAKPAAANQPGMQNAVQQASLEQEFRQHGEPMPSTIQANAVERARAATVRLKVHDGRGYDTGTGTIIDTHGDEALVLTCGHLFREAKQAAKIHVDLFVGGQTRTVPGQVIDYDADNHDIALVAIRPGFRITPVPVVASNDFLRNGQPVFSFGCDQGADPSRRDTRVTGINKYNQHMGASNIEIAVAPVQGRSGGGLFDTSGRLVGVCNAANYQSDVGIYTGPGSIRWQLDRVQLSRLYQNQENNQPPTVSQPRVASLPTTNASTGLQPASNQEVIVIVRDRNAPDTSAKIMSMEPTADVMQFIQNNARYR